MFKRTFCGKTCRQSDPGPQWGPLVSSAGRWRLWASVVGLEPGHCRLPAQPTPGWVCKAPSAGLASCHNSVGFYSLSPSSSLFQQVSPVSGKLTERGGWNAIRVWWCFLHFTGLKLMEGGCSLSWLSSAELILYRQPFLEHNRWMDNYFNCCAHILQIIEL